MNKKTTDFIIRLSIAAKRNSVEVILSVLFCLVGCIQYDNNTLHTEMMLLYFPVLFMVSYMLNSFTRGKGNWRILYFISALFFIPFIWIKGELFSVIYAVTLGITLLTYLVSCREKENRLFVWHGFVYLQALASAFVLSLAVWLLSNSIFYSIQYIFEIWEKADSRVHSYIFYVVFMGVLPLLFLLFIQPKEIQAEDEKVQPAIPHIFNILFNFVLSPALLIYAGILYLYFAKIVILWSLPKGAVAYIVISFTSAAFILKGCRLLQNRTYYDWFYNKVGFYVLPALAMYWVATLYRINEYGFTEARVYLVILGGFLTLCTGMFFSKRAGRYLYMGYCGIGLLACFTYIPGISGNDFGIRSQTNRINEAANKLNIYTPEGVFSTKGNPESDKDKAYYHTLYQAFKYIDSKKDSTFMTTHYGIASAYELLETVVPLSMRDYALYGTNYVASNNYILVNDYGDIDVTGYKVLQEVIEYKKEGKPYYSQQGADSLFIWDEQNNLLLAEDIQVLFKHQLQQAGICNYSSTNLREHGKELLQYKTDAGVFIFKNIRLKTDTLPTVEGIEVAYYLKR